MPTPLSFGLIGAGWIGSFHAETLASRLPGARLAAVADPRPGAAERLSAPRTYRDPLDLIADPSIDAVAICSPATSHADLVVAAAQAGKHVFCEKPMALTLDDADRAIDAAHTAGVALQVGFNRRFATDFAAMRARIVDGAIGTPQLLRSLTRDPGISADVAAQVEAVDDLQRDADPRLRHAVLAQSGRAGRQVFAQADALVHPQFADSGFLDTSVVQIRFDNGAFAIAEASFQAVYGYDIRGEVFGSGGVLKAAAHLSSAGSANIELFADAYVAQFAHFVDCVHAGTEPSVTGADARVALEIALAARESVETAAPVVLNCGAAMSGFQLAVCSEMVFTRPADHRPGAAHRRHRLRRRDLELARQGSAGAGRHRRAVLLDDGLPARRPHRPASADEVVRTAELSIKAAEMLGVPRLNLHTAELVDGKAARPPATARPARCGDGAARAGAHRRARRRGRRDLLRREPQDRSSTTPASRWPAPRTRWPWWKASAIPT